MAKITVCDMCKDKGKLTETRKYMRVKGRADLRLDYCEDCRLDIPKSMTDYAIFVYKLNGIELTKAEAEKMSAR